jgi:Cu(I)/Ag(I) efflux system membrane fusion protein
LKLVDLSRVWVQFDVFEKDVPFVQMGDSLYFSPASNPSLQRKSKIEFVDPLLNLDTRTLRARTSVQGGAGWQPGMIVQGTIVSRSISGIEIPASSLLWAGSTSYVWIKAYDGSFEIREVRTGMRTQNGWLVARGLNGGEEIVVQGVFRLDAAAQLSGKLSMLNRPAEKAETGAWSEQAWMKRVLDVQTFAGDKKASLPVTPEVLSSLTKHYLELTDALVASDFKTAKSISEKLTELIVRHKDNGGDKSLSAVREQVQKIRSSSSITGMRQQLNILSMHLAEWLEAAPKTGDSLYLQYCPMARNDVGGFCISRTREIRNPYFGNSMLECGETISKIQ